jgi:hypothetical protein
MKSERRAGMARLVPEEASSEVERVIHPLRKATSPRGRDVDNLRPAMVAALVACVCFGTGCGKIRGIVEKFTPDHRLGIVLVDLSASTTPVDWQIYEDTFRDFTASFTTGDRVVVGAINDRTLTQFAPIADLKFPDTQVTLTDAESADSVRKELSLTFSKLAALPRANSTCVLSGLTLAQQEFDADHDRTARELLILSDMLEDCAGSRFDREKVDSAYADALVDQVAAKGQLPRLNGVHVSVAGASAPTEKKMLAVQAFWMRFFQRAGAVCEHGMYVRSGLQFRQAPTR